MTASDPRTWPAGLWARLPASVRRWLSTPDPRTWLSVPETRLELVTSLWVAAVATYGVGDFVTTMVGLGAGSIAEGSPLPAMAMARFGPVGLLGLKVVVFGVGYAMWRLVPDPHRIGVPLALSAFGGVLTGWNLVVIAAVSGTLG